VLPPGTRKVHRPLNDPVKDTEEDIMSEFRATRDEVNERVTEFTASLRNEGAI